ncbi:hypothetical protein DPMN_125633 [Dreissena polymorpha]|uniref:PHD-type domain-containing protein n=2 Tax=Dreissena polymorpha TaxID=45954 RepID=A0A9D4GYJ9_DREPO|nr:hypothetical protein DPMN_125633 [Dreissena polymorpha]
MSVAATDTSFQAYTTSTTDSYEMDLDDDFNDILASMDSDEQEVLQFEINDNYDMMKMIEDISFKNPFGTLQPKCNLIISQLDPADPRLLTFIKRIFLKMSNVSKELGKDDPKPIAESVLNKFYKTLYEYTVGLQYTMDCLTLFNIGTENVFEEEHKIVCYKMFEYIREFVLQQRVQLLKESTMNIYKRTVTDASRSRIRYVAGYCVAKLRKKYVQVLKSNMFSCSKASQTTFKEARQTLLILNSFKEEEHYLQQMTSHPDSLIDTERKQNIRHGLTNVTDGMFNFFLNITELCLQKLVNENLTKYGKTMYNNCLEQLLCDMNLYQQFSHMVINKLKGETTEEFSFTLEHVIISEIVDSLVLTSAQICTIYNELVQKYFLVLFAQFCRDVKGVFNITKTMAHRKQIKVSKCSKKSKTLKKQTTKSLEPMDVTAQSPMLPVQPDSEPEPQPGPSYLESDICKKCQQADGELWIQCDSCNSWLHRKCAGLQNAMKWKKYSKAGAKWNCTECE